MGDVKIERIQVEKGVHALLQYLKKKQTKSNEMFAENEAITMQIGFQKVPAAKNKTIKIQLPKPPRHELLEVCLFVKDLNKKDRDTTPSIRHYRELLEEKGVTSIKEILPLKSIKTEYKPYEAKRNLSNMYDVYLADERILRLLPAFLGKNFYRRKRYPVQVNMLAKDLKKEIARALGMTQCIVTGRGSTSQVTIGNIGMSTDDLVLNITAAALKLAESIPGGPNNIKNLHIKTADSPSLPIYISNSSPEDVILPQKKAKPAMDEPEEVTTVMEGKVRVTPYGSIQIIKEGEEATLKKKGDKKLHKRSKKTGKVIRMGKGKKSKKGNVENEPEELIDSPGPAQKRRKLSVESSNKSVKKAKTTDESLEVKEEIESDTDNSENKPMKAKKGTKRQVKKLTGKSNLTGKTKAPKAKKLKK